MAPHRSAVLLVSAVALLSCGGDDLVLPDEGVPATIEIVQGDEQFGRVGEPLAEPIVARVTDTRGRPVTDVPLVLVLDDPDGVEIVPDTASTDVDGSAGFRLVLGTGIGPAGGMVRALGPAGDRTLEAPVRFTAVASDAAGMTLVSGDGQSARVGSPLPQPLVVEVADPFGNPIAGVPITWTLEGGGSLSAELVPTDADGRSSVERVLGPAAGTQRTRAGADGLAGSPVTFVHTATAGAASRLLLVSGDGQSAVVGTPVAEDLVVRLLDAADNPVVGVPVAWVLGEGGGTVAPETTPTDADGYASTSWTLGSAVGEHTVTAVVSGVGVVPFRATASPGTPPGMRLLAQPSGEARSGVPLARQPVIQLVNPDGSDLRQGGVAVTVAVATGAGRIRGTLTRATDDDGRAGFTDLVLEGAPGPYTLAFGAGGFTGAVTAAIQLSRGPTSTTIESDTPDPSAPGASVRVVFSVRSEGGQPAGLVIVRADDGASCQATVAAGSCSLAPTRTGSQRLQASYQGSEQFEPSADTEDHLIQVPALPLLALAVPPSPAAQAGTPFPQSPVIQLRNDAGADLATGGVVVTVAIASGNGALIGTASRTTDAAGRAAFEGLGIGGGTGAHTLRFTASGYTPVTSGPVDVSAAATTIRIESDSPDPSDVGAPVAVRFVVGSAAGTPPGSVTVSAGVGESCTADVAAGGCSLTLIQPGARTLTARYSGGGAFAGSEVTEPHTVREPAAPPPTGPSGSASGVTVNPATITAIVGRSTVRVEVRSAAGDALEGVEVRLAASGSGNTISPATATTGRNGVAEFELRSTVAEAKTITAEAGGVTLDARPSVTVVPVPTETRIESDDPDPSEAGAAFAVRFTVRSGAGTPTGVVTVTGGGQSCSETVAAGSCALTLTEPGDVTLTATYAGDGTFASSSDTERHEVRAPAQRVLRLRTDPSSRALPGEPLERQPVVQLAAEPGGDVKEAGVVVTASLASGSGTLQGQTTAVTDSDGRAPFADLAIAGEGQYTLQFSAPNHRSVVSGSIAVERAATETTITDHDPEPSQPGAPVTVLYRVTSRDGSPTGTVSVSGGGASCAGTVASGGCTLSPTATGVVTLTASYAGDERFAPSADSDEHRVEAANVVPAAADDGYQTVEDGGVLSVTPAGVLANDTDANGDPLRAELVSGPANGNVSLDPDGGFRYTPDAGYAGQDAFTYRASDGRGGSGTATVRITVQPVNDPPSFQAGPDQTVPAGAGPQSVAGWATGISAGPGESGQNLEFLVEVESGGELFAATPSVSPEGTLSYTPSGLPGNATVRIILRDDGGTANGGSDSSPPATVGFAFTFGGG